MADRVLALARRLGVFRLSDAIAAGAHPEAVRRLWQSGRLKRLGRGLYELAGRDFSEHHSLVEAARRVPRGVVCLVSALAFHELTSQFPRAVWVAIDPKARRPGSAGVRLRVVRFSGRALTEGVERHELEGTEVRVFSAAKTVADCFKYRNKIGLDVALEALQEGWRTRRFTLDELRRCARVCRVANVMRPYIEGVV